MDFKFHLIFKFLYHTRETSMAVGESIRCPIMSCRGEYVTSASSRSGMRAPRSHSKMGETLFLSIDETIVRGVRVIGKFVVTRGYS